MRHVVEQAHDAVLENGLVRPGELAVFTAGDPSTSPTIGEPGDGTVAATNVMYVVQIRSGEGDGGL